MIRVIALAAALAACDGTHSPSVQIPVPSRESAICPAIHPTRVQPTSAGPAGCLSTSGYVAYGMRNELASSLDPSMSDEAGDVGIPGSLQILQSYGVDGFGLPCGSSTFTDGPLDGSPPTSDPVSRHINLTFGGGVCTGVDGTTYDEDQYAAAKKLFDAMTAVTEEGAPNDRTRASPHGFISCERTTSDPCVSYVCTLTNLVRSTTSVGACPSTGM